jgi:hypothetical protein
MSNCFVSCDCVAQSSTLELPPDDVLSRGKWRTFGGVPFSRQALPSDPIGTHTLTLTNVVVGSHISIRSQDGTTTHYSREYGSGTRTYENAGLTYDDANTVYDSQYDTAIVIPVYSAGSALNDWRIRIRKGSEAPYYLPYETLMTATVGSSSIYVSQISDQ